MPVVRSLSGVALIGLLSLTAGVFLLPSHHATSAPDRPAAKSAAKPTGVDIEIRCADDSVLKVRMPETKLELATKYGLLQIPVADVRRIEFAFRTSADVAAKVALAASQLNHPEFDTRERATEELKGHRERAYHVMRKLVASEDPEVSRRADEIVKFIETKVPAANLEPREHDVVHTEHSKIAGRLTAETLTVTTSMFGDQPLKLTDVRALKSGHDVPEVVQNAIPAPATMDAYGRQYGQVFTFTLTAYAGPPNPQGSVWGTDVYTLDSSLPAAAVHAGVLKPGQTGTVKVRIIQSPPQFVASPRNGINTAAYGVYQTGAYEFVRK
jgi:hypothetical protein